MLLKTKSCHDANFLVTDSKAGCHHDANLTSMAAPQVVVMTTCDAANDDKVGIITPFFLSGDDATIRN